MTILAVCGLRREARIAGGEGVIAVAGGGNGRALGEKLDALHGDIRGVISIGIAGGLSPLLKVGDVVIADQIMTEAEQWRCDNGWRVALAARLPHVHQGPLAGSGVILKSAKAKAGLHDRTGALAVDMESHIAARFAAWRRVPLAGLRVISDDASHALPPAALVAMKPDGGIALAKVLGSLLRHPLQVPALIRTARGSEKAFAALLRCRDLLGPGLGGVGFSGPDL